MSRKESDIVEIKDDIIVDLVKNSGATIEALGTIKNDIIDIKTKLEEKADSSLNDRVKGLEDDLKPFRPVGKFVQKNTVFVLLSFMVIICIGILKLNGMI